jgi:hypothetical protein
MRIRVEATPAEIRERGTEALERVAERLSVFSPGAEEALGLIKAAREPKSTAERHAVTHHLQEEASKLYARQLDLMLAEIYQVIEREV